MSTMQVVPVNYWLDAACAKAFWGQHELPAYRQLLADTTAWIDPQPGERWIDLGCGGGQLTRALWEKSHGTLAEIVALDCAAANERAIRKLRGTMSPPAAAGQVRFLHADFSSGLADCPDDRFDGAVSGLAIQYAESFCPVRRCWTRDAYDQLLHDVCRVLRPGGCFVFSVNVSEPSWLRVALSGVWGFLRSSHPLHYLKNSWRMWTYGGWLKRQARTGRFHYLPAETVQDKLSEAGFERIAYRLSFARQAYVLRCYKPAG
jgi:ubiquinone/menaquinone biosynthesis C-methylase UbiE